MKIVLHACCGPCSTVPITHLKEQGHELCVFYSNSNIHPQAEYILRRDTAARFAASHGVEFVEGTYDPSQWVEAIGQHRAYSAERCRLCYRTRFVEPAAYAAQIGADALASSLTISPYQFTNVINDELQAAAQANGVAALQMDLRPNYQESVELSRAEGMYRQNFCGCMYSQVEAQEQRTAAKAKRREAKAQRRLARTTGVAVAAMNRVVKMPGWLDEFEEAQC